MADMKPPKKGGTPRRIEAKGPPGGPYTPGARKGKPMPPRSRRMPGATRSRQRKTAMAIQPEGGLGQLMAAQGAPEELVEDVQMVEEMPGGMELLYTVAAEQIMKDAGADPKDAKKVRLYRIGGAVGNRGSAQGRGGGSPKRQFSDSDYGNYAKGGAAQAASKTREAGRGDDSILLHLSPEEFETIEAMWGKAETNPNTGLPEYGFLSKVWKKIKKTVKKIVKSDLFQMIAPIALSIFAPGLGTAIGGALGLGSGAAASVVGNALVRGGLAAAGGRDFATGAISGAISGGLGQIAGEQVGNLLGDTVSEQTANVIGAGLAGGAGAELTGGDFMSGAITGGLGEYMRPTMEGITEKGRQFFGRGELTPEELEAGKILAPRVDEGTRAMEAIAAGEAMYDPATGAYVTDPTAEQVSAAAAMTPGAAEPVAAPTVGGGGKEAVTPAGTGGEGGGLGDFVLPGLMMAGMAGGSSAYEEAQPPELPPHMLESLPVYASNRRFIGPTDPSAYYTYGQAGAPQTGEGLFITPEPFGGEVGTPTVAGGAGTPATGVADAAGGLGGAGGLQGMIAAGQVVPAQFARYGGRQQLLMAGYTQGADGNYYPPEQAAPLGQGTPFARGGSPVSRMDYYEQNRDVPAAIPTVSRRGGHHVRGPGTGRSDDIPARLSDGEYVIDAETVALLGDGSGDAGAKRLDEMRRNLRKHKAKNLKKGEFTHKAKTPEKYMRMGGMSRLRAAAGRA